MQELKIGEKLEDYGARNHFSRLARKEEGDEMEPLNRFLRYGAARSHNNGRNEPKGKTEKRHSSHVGRGAKEGKPDPAKQGNKKTVT